MLTRKYLIPVVALHFFLALCVTAQLDLPSPKGMVSDFSGKLDRAKKNSLEEKLRDFRDRSGIDVAVVLVPLEWLQKQSIESYTREMGRQWGVGRGPQKLGLVLLVAIDLPDDKGVYHGQTRLEVSRNLERDIPNELAGEIIRKMREELKAGRFDQALSIGVDAIIFELTQKRRISTN